MQHGAVHKKTLMVLSLILICSADSKKLVFLLFLSLVFDYPDYQLCPPPYSNVLVPFSHALLIDPFVVTMALCSRMTS